MFVSSQIKEQRGMRIGRVNSDQSSRKAGNRMLIYLGLLVID